MNSQNTYEQRSRNSYYVLVLLCLAYLFDYADRMVMSSLLPFIKVEWSLNDESLGMLTSIVSLFIAIFVIPIAFMVDRWSRKKMVAIMVFLWSFATLACMFANTYENLLWARAITGLGEAGYSSAAVAMLAAAFPVKDRAKYMGIWDAFAPIGAGLGFIVGGYIGLHFGWRNAMGLLALPGVLLAVLFWFVKDYKTVSLSHELEKNRGIDLKNIWNTLIGLIKIKTLWFVYIAFALNIAVNTSIMIWMPSYLHRFYNLDEKQAGMLAGGIALLALVGAPLGGILADKFRKKNIKSRLIVSAISSLLSAIFLFIALSSKEFNSTMVFLLLFGICTVAFLAPASAVVQDVVHPGIRAVAFAINVMIMNIFGSFWAPVAVGRVSDNIGLDKALYLLPILSIFAFLIFFLGNRFYVSDMERVRDIKLQTEE